MKTLAEFTIRQTDFAKKHKLLPGEMKELRTQWLKEDHDFKSIGRPIFFTPNAVKVLEAALGVNVIDPAMKDFVLPEPETLTALVLKPCRNKRFVYAALGDERIAVNVGKCKKDLRRKRIAIRKEGEDYHYVSHA